MFKSQDNSVNTTAYESFPTVTTFLDYMPFMVFTNMFAIFYLEVICMTKKTAKKQDEDKLLGHYINGGITFFYALIFVSMLVLSAFNYNMNAPAGIVTGFGNFTYTTESGSDAVALVQPYSVFLKGWYSQSPNYFIDLTYWNATATPYP